MEQEKYEPKPDVEMSSQPKDLSAQKTAAEEKSKPTEKKESGERKDVYKVNEPTDAKKEDPIGGDAKETSKTDDTQPPAFYRTPKFVIGMGVGVAILIIIIVASLGGGGAPVWTLTSTTGFCNPGDDPPRPVSADTTFKKNQYIDYQWVSETSNWSLEDCKAVCEGLYSWGCKHITWGNSPTKPENYFCVVHRSCEPIIDFASIPHGMVVN